MLRKPRGASGNALRLILLVTQLDDLNLCATGAGGLRRLGFTLLVPADERSRSLTARAGASDGPHAVRWGGRSDGAAGHLYDVASRAVVVSERCGFAVSVLAKIAKDTRPRIPAPFAREHRSTHPVEPHSAATYLKP